MKMKRLLRTLGTLGATAFLLSVPLACDEGTTAPQPQPQTPVNASDWIDQADWDNATIVTVTMMEESPTSYVFQPNSLTFEAGKPYILRIENPAGNVAKHYFATEGLGDFYKAIATRKIQTPDAEYKAPHFEAVELKIGGTLEIYFVAVLAGTYDIVCTIPGHKELGMIGDVTITGGQDYQLDLEVASDFNTALSSDARKSGGHAVWAAAVNVSVGMVETESAYAFDPTDLALTKDVGYVVTLDNPAGNTSKHYYTATNFYKSVVTRKAEDSHAEIKPLYFNAIELLIGGSTELFMVPTSAGTYDSECTIPGHASLGMIGSVMVSEQ